MKKLSHAEISKNRLKLTALHEAKKMPVVVALNSIRSNYNVGSIFRTSDGAMIESLYLCGYTPHPPKKEILKTALGSTESISWFYEKNIFSVIEKMKSEGYKIVALELASQTKKYYEVGKEDFPICLIIGNEITGISDEILSLCDFSIEIPQFGIKQSLNVAVAYGIAIFELRKIFENEK